MVLESLRSTFESLCRGLNKTSIVGESALNYSVSTGVWVGDGLAGSGIEASLKQLLGPQVQLGGTAAARPDDALRVVTEAFAYVGDEHSHPNRKFLTGANYGSLMQQLGSLLGEQFSTADLLVEVWLAEGHPFYPVFWDFAYLWERGPEVAILISSASD